MIADSGVSYESCDLTIYVEDFSPDPPTTSELLESERCWKLDAPGDPDGTGNFENVFAGDGDLVVQARAPATNASDRWVDALAFQQLEGDFVIAARVEAVNQTSGDHCFESEDSMVGIVVRRPAPQVGWSALLIGPYEPASLEIDQGCEDDAAIKLPTRAVARSSSGAASWGPEVVDRAEGDPEGVAFEDGETDIAICANGGKLFFYYYRGSDSADGLPIWELLDGPDSEEENLTHDAGSGALWEVGLTAAGAGSVFEVEGHFTSVIYVDTTSVPDGCRGALEELRLPVNEP